MSSSTPSSSSSSIPQFHVHPHATHLNHNIPPIQPAGESSVALEEEEEHDYESLPVGSGWAVNMAAGAMAGISEHAAIFPVDSIKTRMQVLPALNPILSPLGAASSSASATATATASSSAARAAPPQLNTIMQHVRSISTTEGLRSLWRGVASVILGAGPAHAAHFGMYEFVREISGGRGEGWAGVAGTALAGAAATVSSDALMNPFDVIKQRMQIRNSPHRTVLSCARTVYAREGLAAFYVSYPTTLTMSVPFTAVQFSAYESLKTLLNPDGSYSPITHCTAGGIAGGLAAAVTTPLDVAKTLLQTRGSNSDPRIRAAKSMGEALRIIKDRDGWKGLRRGMLPRVLTVAPSTAISWMSYEFFSE
uniref:Solute carrier family 25 (Mitochondrial iron transporter), member 28/37 n=1 Tax=Kwoniella bestiolae CBS 10118 TaxID=1296100 RepID=A0A1B9FTL0_9TREE|nr:solute carrier family 25 (mitochondrial iron transporter), member 28/37 [Kwoniella bestiolae CBS 10118]OCF22117.1 solute carrier family 25 (mitochondrial iron transporter), member 28/37 [Kwoniella bestiolae CBS 10118]